MENKIKITFDSCVKHQVLSLLDKAIDSNGYIVEKSNKKQRVLTVDGEQIKEEELAGLRVGSEVFIKKDLPSIMELSKL